MARYLLGMIMAVALLQTGCKVVNTHTFKVTGSVSRDSSAIYIPTQKSQLVLAVAGLSEKQEKALMALRYAECLDITSAEKIERHNGQVRLSDFRFVKLMSGTKKCQKLKSKFAITVR